MLVDRAELLQTLETVEPGTSSRDIIHQSSCFVFHSGKVYTFNGSIACRTKTGLDARVEGAVKADKLLNVLRKMPEKEVDVSNHDGTLKIQGRNDNRGSKIRLEEEIKLPFDQVEKVGKEDWQPLAARFGEALAVTKDCVSKDETLVISCLHIHSRWIEGYDDYQLARFRVETGFDQSVLIKPAAAKHVVDLGMSRFALTENWLHFKNENGLVLSCVRYAEEYPDITPNIKQVKSGEPMASLVFPRGLSAALEGAKTFSEDEEDDEVLIEIKAGKMRVTGVSVGGEYYDKMRADYEGPEVKFTIPNNLLSEIIKKHSECQVNGTHLAVRGDEWVYITCLTEPGVKDDEQEDHETGADSNSDSDGGGQDSE